MPTPHLTRALAEKDIAAVNKALKAGYRPPGVSGLGPAAINIAAKALGRPRTSLVLRLVRYKDLYDMEPNWSLWKDPAKPTKIEPVKGNDDYHGIIRDLMLKGEPSLAEMAAATGLPEAVCGAIVTDLEQAGSNVRKLDDGARATIDKTLQPAFVHGPQFGFVSETDNTFKFGVISDTHLGSKYERLDVLNAEYDRFEAAGIERVFHCGNWIDGECRFNKHDLHTHGMEPQCNYMAEVYPKREGITTYAVAGDDHEGWYAQREGVDIGRFAEGIMVDAGHDWVNLGYMEAYVSLINANTAQTSIMAVVHPGGGSAYAESYAIQKIVESLEGGEKPAVALYGHYHKMLAGEYRNVWWLQAGCTKDQDPFARKKKIRYTIGGTIVHLVQDEAGAITGFLPHMNRYFNRGYYQDRWKPGGKSVELPERGQHP